MTPHSRTPRRLRGIAFAALTIAFVVGGGWLLTARDNSAPTSAEAAFGGKIVEEFAPGDRAEITHFEGDLLDGGTLNSDKLIGRVVVYNVWGSWCGPCRMEAPDLAQVATETRDDTTFVGINVRDNDAAARAFERNFAVPYTSVKTEDSAQALLAFGGALASAAVPSTVVLDRQGKVAARVIGPVTYSTLSALVESVVAEESSVPR